MFPNFCTLRMPSKIQEVENDMFEYVKTSDYTLFVQTFNLYLGLYPTTENTLYLKSIALLYHLGRQSMREYYTLLQSVKICDLDDKHILFVLEVEDAAVKCDTQGLSRLAGGCGDGVRDVMNMLIRSVCAKVEKVLAEDISQNDVAAGGGGDVYQNIKDCLFVCREFSGN